MLNSKTPSSCINFYTHRERQIVSILGYQRNYSIASYSNNGQEGGINKLRWSSGGGGGTFVVRGANAPLIIAGGGGGLQSVNSRHGGCDASTQTTGNPGYQSWSGGSNGHGAQTAGDGVSGKNIL